MITHTHTHTYTHDNYYNPRCAHAHRGLMNVNPWGKQRVKEKAAICVHRALNRDNICAQKRAKYALGEPKLDVKDMYVKEILHHLLANAEARTLVGDSFPKCI